VILTTNTSSALISSLSSGSGATSAASSSGSSTSTLENSSMTIRSMLGSQAIVMVPTRNSSVIGASSGSVSRAFADDGGTAAGPVLRRTTSSRTRSRCSARTDTCCFSQATLVMRLPSRAWRKKARSPGCPTVPATKRSGSS
jgi:hypothetical protein